MPKSVSFGWLKVFNIIAQMVVDDRVRQRGHGQQFFSGLFSRAGVVIAPHKLYSHCYVFDFFG